MFLEQNLQLDDESTEGVQSAIVNTIDDALETIRGLEADILAKGLSIPSEDANLISNIKRDLNALKDEPLTAESLSDTKSSEKILEIIKKIGKRKYRVYSKKKDKKTGERKNMGTYSSLKKAKERKRNIEFFKHAGGK